MEVIHSHPSPPNGWRQDDDDDDVVDDDDELMMMMMILQRFFKNRFYFELPHPWLSNTASDC